MKISIQGRPGSFHHIAAQQYMPHADALSRKTFRKVFADVDTGEADLGIVAIENSLYGSINEVYDQLLHSKLHVVGEVYLRIVHCLIGFEGSNIADLKDVYSMRPAIAQCTNWIDEHLSHVDIHTLHDTAESVEFVAQAKDHTKAAIASEQAAKLNGLSILKRSIETNKANYTRFIILSQTPYGIESANKTSLAITLDGSLQSGSLHDALTSFADRDINLSKIESRPIPGTHWEYMFYIDIAGTQADSKIIEALNELEAHGHSVKVLGSYQEGTMPQVEQ